MGCPAVETGHIPLMQLVFYFRPLVDSPSTASFNHLPLDAVKTTCIIPLSKYQFIEEWKVYPMSPEKGLENI